MESLRNRLPGLFAKCLYSSRDTRSEAGSESTPCDSPCTQDSSGLSFHFSDDVEGVGGLFLNGVKSGDYNKTVVWNNTFWVWVNSKKLICNRSFTVDMRFCISYRCQT